MYKKLSAKDKSFILFIAAGLVVLWTLYSLFSYLFFTSTFNISDANKLIIQDEKSPTRWINSSRSLDLNDLKDRVILLDFATYACVNCVNILPEIKKLEQEYGSKLTVITVYSGRFENEKNFSSIVKAVLKHDISHLVIDDSEQKITKNFGITAWPSLVLINPHGNVEEIFVGAEEAKKMPKKVKKLISRYKYQISHEGLPIVLEKNKIAQHVLNYPTKLAYAAYFAYKSHNAPALFISNTGKNSILAVSLNGEIIAQIGSTKDDFEDGDFENASFSAPQGLIYKDNKLYVADSGNHAIREIDFAQEKVTTIAGNGRQGTIFSAQKTYAANAELSSPVDIEFYPDSSKIAIANSGTHQILQYDLQAQKISLLAGNGKEGIDDGANPNNSLAQTADMAVYDGKLYFIDSESSSLRVLNKDGEVKTLIGKGINSFGHENGKKETALMQHPLGLMIDDGGIYIADSFNHKIRKYGLNSGEIHDLIGAKGESLGATAKTEFDEPQGILSIHDNFYVADTNNNRVIIINRKKLNSELLDVMPQLKLPKESFLEYLPNLHRGLDIAVASDKEISLNIDFKKGWKLNDLGPSFINLLEIVSDEQAVLLASFDWNMIKNEALKLPKLQSGKKYVLQATIYYCETRKNALCHISSYERKILAQDGEKNTKIAIELFYQ